MEKHSRDPVIWIVLFAQIFTVVGAIMDFAYINKKTAPHLSPVIGVYILACMVPVIAFFARLRRSNGVMAIAASAFFTAFAQVATLAHVHGKSLVYSATHEIRIVLTGNVIMLVGLCLALAPAFAELHATPKKPIGWIGWIGHLCTGVLWVAATVLFAIKTDTEAMNYRSWLPTVCALLGLWSIVVAFSRSTSLRIALTVATLGLLTTDFMPGLGHFTDNDFIENAFRVSISAAALHVVVTFFEYALAKPIRDTTQSYETRGAINM